MSLLHADVVVVGTELCALGAAAQLAHNGRRVVCIDDAEAESTTLGPFLVPRAPALWRLPSAGPASELIDKLGLRQDARRLIGEPAPIGLIDDPDVRVAIFPDPEARGAELRRAFGMVHGDKIADAIASHVPDARDALFAEATMMDEKGFFASRRRAKRFVGTATDPSTTDAAVRNVIDAGFGDALEAALPFAQWSAGATTGGLGGFCALSALASGSVAHDKNGRGLRSALRDLFERVITGHGGEVVTSTRVSELDLSKPKAPVVNTDGKNHYATSVVLDGTTGQTLRTRASKPANKVDPEGEAVVRKGGAAIVRWLLERKWLPRGLPERALILPGKTSLPPLLIGMYDALPVADKKSAAKYNDICAVLVAGRFARETHGGDTDAMNERLRQLMPFADKARIAHDAFSGSAGALIMPTYVAGNGVLGGRSLFTKIPSMFRAGRELCPALGLEGELAAAAAVSKAAAACFKDAKS